jgi:hypothetical protein
MTWHKLAQNKAIGQDAAAVSPDSIYYKMRERTAHPIQNQKQMDDAWIKTVRSIRGHNPKYSSGSWQYIDYDRDLRKKTDKTSPTYQKGLDFKIYFTIDAQDGSEDSMQQVLSALVDLPSQLDANLAKHGVALLYKIPGSWSSFLREADNLVIYHPFPPNSEWTNYIMSIVRGWMQKWKLIEGKRSYNEGWDWFEKTEATHKDTGAKVVAEHDETKKRFGWLQNEYVRGNDNGGSFGTVVSKFISLASKNPNDPRWKNIIKNGTISVKDAADWLMNHAKENIDDIAKSQTNWKEIPVKNNN